MEIDHRIVSLATRQYGQFALRQLRELGGDRRLANRRVDSGRWEWVNDRVLKVAGTPTSPEQALMARVLKVGPTGRASREAAAWLWRVPGFAATDVVTRDRGKGGRATEVGHRPTLLLPHHLTSVRGIPCSTLPRTIYDLAGIPLPLGRMAVITDAVVTKSPAMLKALHAMLPELACRGREGITTIRTLLEERPIGTVVPASGNERRFESVCRNAGITGFERQIDVGGHSWLGRVDYRHHRLRLIVEIDSVLHHTSATDVANDQARDSALLAGGWRRVLRLWEEDLWPRPWTVVDQLRCTMTELATLAA